MSNDELNEWIAENVMGYIWTCHNNPVAPFVNKKWLLEPNLFADLSSDGRWKKAIGTEEALTGHEGAEPPSFTTDPAASDALDDKILEKLGGDSYTICFLDGQYSIFTRTVRGVISHTDKKICRALFAHKLFSK